MNFDEAFTKLLGHEGGYCVGNLRVSRKTICLA